MKFLSSMIKTILSFFVAYYIIGAAILSMFLPYFVFKHIDEKVTVEVFKKEYLFGKRSVVNRVYGALNNNKCVMFFPGRKGGIFDYQTDLFPTFVETGYTVHALSYPGYEGAKGSSDLTMIKEIVVPTVKQISNAHQCDPKRIVYAGRSLGATIALAVAQEVPPSKIIIDSLGVSLISAINYHLLQRWYLKPLIALPLDYLIEDINSIDLIGGIPSVPVFIFQGTDDKQTPYDALQKLYEFDHVELIQVEGATHATTHLESLALYRHYLSM